MNPIHSDGKAGAEENLRDRGLYGPSTKVCQNKFTELRPK